MVNKRTIVHTIGATAITYNDDPFPKVRKGRSLMPSSLDSKR